jgi:DNA-binding transcriptional MerR regulator
MRIGQIAKKCGVSRDTLRLYEKMGLISSRRTENGYRLYHKDVCELVRYIKTAQRLGFTLAEISAQIPQLWNQDVSPNVLYGLFQEKIDIIQTRINELEMLRDNLKQRQLTTCPLIGE